MSKNSNKGSIKSSSKNSSKSSSRSSDKNSGSTRIYNKFEFWSVADCACELCPFYSEKDRKCTLDVCCCADIKEEAVRREMAANGAHTGDAFAVHTNGSFMLGGVV